MFSFIKEKKLYIILISLGVAALFCLLFFSHQEDDDLNVVNDQTASQQPMTQQELVDEPPLEEKNILIDVKGAVGNPGVYEAQEGDRVLDLIDAAGGLENDADEKMVNFAQRVTDEMVLYIPKIGEESVNSSFAETDEGTVNINSADSAELQTLPGIGPAKAEAIIDYREKNGPFSEKEGLKEISGIGDKTYEKLAEQIKVN
ncbi:helix-hairpin-helix domain-containing protein [Cytobacillus gottheilii]|uniref:helix-hairpin-helix domain-containing protein n=1 Tax=Cytobacillus gottheilii TaxID=859144 RepID=UPI002148E348|nr:helix-hairpin-helix domain-containing protein [Cytobacillus gottheilii]